jgi:hypothetical protein
MPRLTPIAVCLALLQGLVLAPYQHIHPGEGPGNHHSAVVHTHFNPPLVRLSRRSGSDLGPAFNGLHKPHASVSLETFTTLPQMALYLFFQPVSVARIFVPSESDVLAEIIEPCGHDPPGVENTAPRAPPL